MQQHLAPSPPGSPNPGNSQGSSSWGSDTGGWGTGGWGSTTDTSGWGTGTTEWTEGYARDLAPNPSSSWDGVTRTPKTHSKRRCQRRRRAARRKAQAAVTAANLAAIMVEMVAAQRERYLFEILPELSPDERAKILDLWSLDQTSNGALWAALSYLFLCGIFGHSGAPCPMCNGLTETEYNDKIRRAVSVMFDLPFAVTTLSLPMILSLLLRGCSTRAGHSLSVFCSVFFRMAESSQQRAAKGNKRLTRDGIYDMWRGAAGVGLHRPHIEELRKRALQIWTVDGRRDRQALGASCYHRRLVLILTLAYQVASIKSIIGLPNDGVHNFCSLQWDTGFGAKP
ncbi:hypothetical protein K438DRAFT_1760070 [Mycena galopus ATCC 62051]|nr:hypothetical protein K438DRAFT_1760070 [Mycena galopus ATCC 62051]